MFLLLLLCVVILCSRHSWNILVELANHLQVARRGVTSDGIGSTGFIVSDCATKVGRVFPYDLGEISCCG